MSYRKLSEGTRSLIIDYVQANIAAALDVVAGAVGPPKMTLENPKSYFIYPKPHGYQVPAVFVINDDFDFRIVDKKANCINARVRVNVSILVEDQDAEILTYKSDRYLSALHSVLDQADIVSTDNMLALKVVVYRARFSPVYSRQEDQVNEGTFRKEVLLECEVEHVENF